MNCIANVSDNPNAVIGCQKEATHVVREPRGADAAIILGRDFTNHLMCEDHVGARQRALEVELERAFGARTSAYRLSNVGAGPEIIIVATMATDATLIRRVARRAELACYSCLNVHLSTEFDASTQLCPACYDEAGWENEHSDTNGEHGGRAPVAVCPICANYAKVLDA